jgi:hypothetical protein
VTLFATGRGVANLAYWVTGTEGSNPSLGRVVAVTKVAGLHHRYERLAA